MKVVRTLTVDELQSILRNSSTILLVDWPNVRLPITLLKRGFIVYGRSPKGYSEAELLSEPPPGTDSIPIDVGEEREQKGFLVFRRLEGVPSRVDIVHIYRPAEELKQIIESVAVTLNAKVIWLQPPVRSNEARVLASEHGFGFIEGVDIIDELQGLDDRRS
jgi:CoA binding domain